MSPYKIGEFEFTQGKIVLGKMKKLISIFSSLGIEKITSTVGILSAISPKIGEIFSIILDGGTFKDIPEKIQYLEDNVTYDQTVEIIEDFLVLNPIYNTITKLVKGLGKVL